MADVAADSVAVRISTSSSCCGNGSVDAPVPFALEPIGGSAASPSLIASLPLSSPSVVGSAIASSLLGELKGAVSSLSSTAEASMSPRTEGLSTSSTTAVVEVGGGGEAGVAEGGVTLPICIDGLSACLLLVVESFDGRRSRDRSLSGEVGTKFPCRLWPFFLRLGVPAAPGVGSPELGTKIRRPHSCRCGCSDDVDAVLAAPIEAALA